MAAVMMAPSAWNNVSKDSGAAIPCRKAAYPNSAPLKTPMAAAVAYNDA